MPIPATKSVFQGALLTVAMRWSDRLVGLVSMMVLARLLTPADFGIVAMASVVVGLIDVLLNFGVNVALIHNDKADRADYDTAWTLRIIQSSLTGLLILIGAPFASSYYANPLVEDVMYVMALSVVIAGLENIGIVAFQKNMEFGNDFRFFFYKRVLAFVVTLICAWLLRNYWAMVIGALAGRAAGVALSYSMHHHRPRLSLARLSSLWSFSQWVLVQSIGSYLDSRTDKVLVGGRSGAGLTGIYAIADEIAAMPTTELLAPLGRVLFPALVRKRDDVLNFSRSILTAIGVQALVAIPACVGLAMVADDAVRVLLGEKWAEAVPLIQILAFVNLVVALTHAGGYALLAIGKVKILAMVTWLQAILFLSTAMLIMPQADPSQIAMIRLTVLTGGSLIVVGMLVKEVEALRAPRLFGAVVRPLLAAGGMALGVGALHALIPDLHPLVRLLAEITVGGLIYAGGIVVMWDFVGRPEGAEKYLLSNILARRARTGDRL